MIRYLNEKDVEGLLTMALAVGAVEQAMKDRALHRADEYTVALLDVETAKLRWLTIAR